jgi:hypothetical protein
MAWGMCSWNLSTRPLTREGTVCPFQKFRRSSSRYFSLFSPGKQKGKTLPVITFGDNHCRPGWHPASICSSNGISGVGWGTWCHDWWTRHSPQTCSSRFVPSLKYRATRFSLSIGISAIRPASSISSAGETHTMRHVARCFFHPLFFFVSTSQHFPRGFPFRLHNFPLTPALPIQQRFDPQQPHQH